MSTELGNPSGGTSVLVPAGWQVGSCTVLVPGKAVAVLLADRSCQFYLVSVYFHPDHVRDDLRAVRGYNLTKLRPALLFVGTSIKPTGLIRRVGNYCSAVRLRVMLHQSL